MRSSRFLAILPAGLFTALFLSPAMLAGQDFTYTISTTQAWTDTGLDLQAGDTLHLSATPSPAGPNVSACDPRGVSGAPAAGLPLASAPPGALIARLNAQGATPVLVGAGRELPIKETSHLFLGVNTAGAPPCQGNFVVKAHKVAASGGLLGSISSLMKSESSAPASASGPTPSNSAQPSTPATSETAASSSTGETPSRNERLKSQLSTAADVFMQGQFGMGKTEANGASNAASGNATASALPALKVSDTPLDAGLRKDLDSLPRRVNDQFKNLGDMVNFVIVGSEKSLQSALDAANWHVADTSNSKAALAAVMQTYDNKDYLAMPMSTLYLFGRVQDFGYEMAEPIAMVASRHHFRIWKTPFTWNGQEVWAGAGTHDIGFAKDKRNGSVTHKIDPAVDGERDNIGASLQKSNKVKSLTYYLPPNPVQDASNATGDGYHSDGRLLVIVLQ